MLSESKEYPQSPKDHPTMIMDDSPYIGVPQGVSWPLLHSDDGATSKASLVGLAQNVLGQILVPLCHYEAVKHGEGRNLIVPSKFKKRLQQGLRHPCIEDAPSRA